MDRRDDRRDAPHGAGERRVQYRINLVALKQSRQKHLLGHDASDTATPAINRPHLNTVDLFEVMDGSRTTIDKHAIAISAFLVYPREPSRQLGSIMPDTR
jgi:hypothetical protein